MRLLKRVFGFGVLAVAVLYAADYISARVRGSGALGSVQIQPMYAVPLKNGKTAYMLQDPEMRTCVKSVAPHFGYSPCWYLERHQQQRIKM